MISIKLKPKTKEEQHEENLRRIKALRPIDDNFMRVLFRNDRPLVQMVLRIITGISDLVLIKHETQYDLKRLGGSRSVCLDALGVDSFGHIYNIEVEKSEKRADPKRARFHSSSIDVENLDPGQDFDELPDTYVIFITEHDVFGEGKAIYPIERINTATGKSFDDGEHIIYVNGAYEGDTELGWLMHDFRCSDADEMHYELLAEKTRYYKEEPKGVSEMCKIFEEMVVETRAEDAYRFALNLLNLNELSYEKISAVTGLTIEEVKEIAEENGIITV